MNVSTYLFNSIFKNLTKEERKTLICKLNRISRVINPNLSSMEDLGTVFNIGEK